MKKKSLFNRYEAYTPKGGELSDELAGVLDPIIKKWAGKGYSTRDIELIAIDVITMTTCIERMTRAMKLRKKEKAGVVE